MGRGSLQYSVRLRTVSGSLDGDFDPANPMPAVWDIIVVSHEIGHNFNSPHTHCYQGIPDASYPDAVDPCYSTSGSSSCYSGTALPAGCPGSGQACGTIMSYCHLRSGGYGNIALTFGGSVVDGSSHAYGVFPERVPDEGCTTMCWPRRPPAVWIPCSRVRP